MLEMLITLRVLCALGGKQFPPPPPGVGASARAAGFVTLARPFRAGRQTDGLSALKSQRVEGPGVRVPCHRPDSDEACGAGGIAAQSRKKHTSVIVLRLLCLFAAIWRSAVTPYPRKLPQRGRGKGGGISPRSGLRNPSPAL
ncbi:hypothetical protein A6A03_06505 [Chloroflexus islandicus]|uniref:Uncharacterized protein n=1 Tax=Chloroflexus islandicus TaxID=1707952 RepID=A0A178MLX1_9CHLR|nr:hypothetical protein A6A03_06505 [Chloroflexus islandicus]